MRINNSGRGIHQREIPGIDKLRAALPRDWYGFTNLELHLSPGETRENDAFLVIEDRILLVDLKDWFGKVESDQGRWFHNNRDMGPSPVEKVRSNARKVAEVLKRYLLESTKRQPGAKISVPFFQGCVVFTGKANTSGIAQNEQPSIFTIDEFVRILPDPTRRAAVLGPGWVDRVHALTGTDGYWRQILGDFFNVQTGPFRPRQRLYGTYRATSEHPAYDHRRNGESTGIYREYEAEDDGPGHAPGLLRVWDFSRAATRFHTEDGRAEIAGREREAIQYLKDRNPEFDIALLQPKDAEPERSPSYWEVFEKRRQLHRLRDMNLSSRDSASDAERIELARSLLYRVKTMHDIDATHLDVGSHSIWLEKPSTVKLSHLFAASYPTLQSLGDQRYQFLTAGWKYPEDILGESSDNKRRDVFLLGAAVHQLLFGTAPSADGGHNPPEWNPDIDTDDRYVALHDWFKTALSSDVSSRFPDAATALAEFNAAVKPADDFARTLGRLDRFRVFADQVQLFEQFPIDGTLKRTDSVIVWKSNSEGRKVVVKLWKRTCWGDDRLESPRILSFLERAQDFIDTPVPGAVRLLKAAFLGDAIVVIHEYIDGLPLDRDQHNCVEYWRDAKCALGFINKLIDVVNGLHALGVAHGDLKPSNVIVRIAEDGSRSPVLIDLPEFASSDDGEILTTAYAPTAGGSRFERDRFSVTVMAEEIMARAGLAPEALLRLASAIQICRLGPPPNATLLPLSDTLHAEMEPSQDVSKRYEITLPNRQNSTVLPDEGVYAVRLNRNGNIAIRGASEELEFRQIQGRLIFVRAREVDQGYIGRISRYEHFKFPGEIAIVGGRIENCQALEFILEHLSQAPAEEKIVEPALEQLEPALPDDDDSEDQVVESAYLTPTAAAPVDVPGLWRALIDTEQELFTEGTAISDSVYRVAQKKHLVPIELERGAFDFARHDRVVVERPKKGNDAWFEIGRLDVAASGPNAISFEATGRNSLGALNGPIIRDGDRLRFKSLLETYSRTRREAAISRILSRQSIVPDLVDFFDGTAAPHGAEAIEVDIAALKDDYYLNEDQIEAFTSLLNTRPLGLLQGPPGTGKSLFIASLIHYVLDAGIVRNVLLASQSHEAVNNAAEVVTALFRGNGEEPSLVRVGQEGAVSTELRSFHAERIEGLYKDRFRAELRERLSVIGHRLGLNAELVEKLAYAETAIRPVVDRLRDLDRAGEESRLAGLKTTLDNLCRKLEVCLDPSENWSDDGTYDDIIDAISRNFDTSQDRIYRFLRVSKIARDWYGSVSTRQRSFESFLAGTRSIVAGTCVGLGRSSLGLTQTRFDLVVIDEAARCTASELAVPMQAGRWIILVGDQNQLEPHHRPDVVETVAVETRIPKLEILKSDFERVFASPYGRSAGKALRTQYRMLPPIGRVVSSAFYGGRLAHGRTEPKVPDGAVPRALALPLVWVATDTLGTRAAQRKARTGRSLENESEVDAVIAVLRDFDAREEFHQWLSGQSTDDYPIGIICTYAAQRDLIRRRLPAAGLSTKLREACKIGTVDSYQGKQNRIVILSLVRNNSDGADESGHPTIRPGFMAQPNRINVALSRAMDHLIIVGAMTRWSSNGPLSSVIEAFQQEVASGNAAVINAASYVEASRPVSSKRKSKSNTLEKA